SYSGFVNGDTTNVLTGSPTLSTTADTNSSVGSYDITATQGSLVATNYLLNFTNGTLTVNPAILTVTADNQSRTYGATNPLLTASYTGFVSGESTNVLGASPTLSTWATTNSSVGCYSITVTNGPLPATNYSLIFVVGPLAVNAAALTVTADNQNRLYG